MAETVTGRVRVVDGDTLELGGRRIRLHGIDAPETDQPCQDATGRTYACGEQARAHLSALIGKAGAGVAPLRCVGDEVDRYGRLVAKCWIEARDLGREMVRDGMAWAYRRYSLDYVDDEKRAMAAGRGLWAGEAVDPAEWRATGPVPKAVQASGCDIKGNISGNGRIYHLPGQRSYGATRIDTDRGERWFCTEAEARAAGWRPVAGGS